MAATYVYRLGSLDVFVFFDLVPGPKGPGLRRLGQRRSPGGRAVSITLAGNLRRATPYSAARQSGIRLRALELVASLESSRGIHARQPFTDKYGIHKEAIVAHHIGKMAAVTTVRGN